MERVYNYRWAAIYALYLTKVERKGRTKAELDEVLRWLTGFEPAELEHHLEAGSTLRELFAAARLTEKAALITGVVCGVRVEAIEDPLMQKIRMMDKLVDELAKGKAVAKVLRT
jgi:hypothetical protein